MARKKGMYYRIGIDKRKFGGKVFTFDGYVQGTLGSNTSKEYLQKRGYLVRTRKGGIGNSYEVWKRKH